MKLLKTGVSKTYRMPKVKNQTFRIRIIDELLSRHKWVKTSTIKNTIESRMAEDVGERTIQQDITDMKVDTRLEYYAPIEYNKSRKAYTYSEEGYTIKNFKLKPEEIDALKFYAECLQVFSGYKLFDAFTSGIEKVIDGVQTRKVLKPTSNAKLIVQTDSLVTAMGGEFMGDMVYAIDNRHKCEIEYLPFGEKKMQKRSVLPLLLREYRNRWYLLSYRLDIKEIRNYALDRIKKFKSTGDIMEELTSFDPQTYFNHSFGIITPDAPVETIFLQFTKKQAPYILSLPIHKSQKIIRQTSRSLTISITVMLSYEVYEYILSKSPDVKVTKPAHLAKDIADRLRKSANIYRS
jgi:predicted DNA-binding transcriptional regulator YafY